jgi:hypothetical protein
VEEKQTEKEIIDRGERGRERERKKKREGERSEK